MTSVDGHRGFWRWQGREVEGRVVLRVVAEEWADVQRRF
jgi:hypothetical protein